MKNNHDMWIDDEAVILDCLIAFAILTLFCAFNIVHRLCTWYELAAADMIFHIRR